MWKYEVSDNFYLVNFELIILYYYPYILDTFISVFL